MKTRAGAVLLVLTIGATTAADALARTAVYRDPPSYKGVSTAPKTVAPPSPAPPAPVGLSAAGSSPI